ncbi:MULTISPECIES: Ti-type conjugative transfer relaxase TraA [Chelatococcus]|uniref:Ti-type conjugative transfer relaxase TraA n=1 Tax=Chelatococcus TaxID=28209 RepID=UPI001BD19749|nr:MULTISPECIES: Ti-type conjugative transfer relaxase TraA [Chelatococcus]CAH1647944.1 Conjugal transfer protein TraA [Hyphomicrobiales bacterium]MBS7701639.1 Ti-type conjugative transfer relaxase TraA [Chelatococcus sp. YT9]MBS7743780.1 Ti-type conjugative transfer relaxase TraA [Chelatococcus sp. HY11]MBX3540284.1 Ti-type conjugative transfer relaxase TraA [Chelatococcus sp.]CAH1657291.1 Conjugal transfer protein TraA [Chelatococcus asaccharovorans]
MAIYHFSMKPVSRKAGRSAVAAMAYRAGEKLTNERDGITHDYTAKQGVEHAEIVLPEPGAGPIGVNADWARDRSALWNAAEFAEKRKDARVAREFEVALPHELSAEQRLEATREMAQELADRYGAAVDFAIHAPHEASDVRNHHAHILMTTRQVTEEGLGEKTYLERENKWLLAHDLPTTDMQLRDLRQKWEGIANERLAMAGLDIRIDHRSHMERGLEIAPTEHMGVHATQMDRRGLDVSRARLDRQAAARNADLIREKPEQVLTIITGEKSVFDRRDVARALHRYINDDPQEFRNAFATVMASPALVELQPERTNAETGEVELARYSTREMVEIESGMVASAERLHQARNHGVDRRHVDRAIERQDAALQRSAGDASARLSDEQRAAIEHVTGRERIAAVVGFAGAGKSTMLAAAREAWEAEGYTVHGAALSGKAAEGLEESSGIQSRTLAGWDYGWQAGRNQLGRGDVFVIDEAGMIGSRQLSRFVNEAEARGAKIVLVGDHEQLQAIGAGAAFRAIAEQIGHAELSEIRRQRVDWQREASVAFATHRTAEGLAAYREHGDIRFSESGEDARGEIVRDYLADRDQRPDGTRVAMAHRRADVRAINEAIRSELQERGKLARANVAEDGPGSGDVAQEATQERKGPAGGLTFQTNDGKRDFATGDRIVFLENNRDLRVKNGMLATVDHVEPGRIIATLDGPKGAEGRSVAVPMNDYQAIDHGYATTIHKNQGATVDRSFVLASGTMDRHLTYVAMTRHRDGAQLYAAHDEFADRHAGQTLASGRLVEHGVAPYEHQQGNSQSYFVTLENDKGQRHTVWGVDLERAMKESGAEVGDKIGLEHRGSEPVRLPDGTTAERNSWKVRDAGELAYSQLESRLSRSGVKETTLDYAQDFAERRGIAERMGVRSEIEIPDDRAAELRPDREPAAERSVPATLGLGGIGEGRDQARETASAGRLRPGIAKNKGEDLARVSRAEDLAQDRGDRQQRRSRFEGLKLSRSAPANQPTAQDRDERPQDRPEKAETRRRGMFDGLRLNVGPAGREASQEPGERPEREGSLRQAPAQDRLAERLRPQSEFEQAVDRYARAYESAHRQRREGLPILDAQRQDLREAGLELDQARPGARDLMRSALRYDPDMQRSMTELSGRPRVGQVIERLDHERAMQADPNVRADRFVERWQALQEQRQQLRGWQHDEARGKVEGQMNGLTKSLERDPQVESILRNRRQELGIGQHTRQSERISWELQQSLTRGRSLGLER